MGKRAKAKDTKPAVGDKPFLYVQLRTFGHATEDLAKVESALATAAGLDLAEPDGAKRFREILKRTTATGHFNNPIHILETELTRARDVRRFWDRLFTVDGVGARLLREADQRLDEDLVLWFRIDKQRAAQGEIALSLGEDVIHVRAKLATYPKDRTVALDWLEGFLRAYVARADADAS